MVADRNVLPTRTRFHWRLTRRNKQEISICTRVALFSVAALAYAGIAVAGPTGGEIVGGSGTITQSGPTTDINQASQRLDINWQTFSTGVNESVNFYQPGASAVAINRVVGGVPSELRGALTANGRVFILNQAGVTFYSTSRVNVGALLATTAANVAIDGDSFSFSGDGYGRVVNQGDIKVSDGGFAILAAPYVSNAGVIEANLGEVRLVSTNAYTLDLRGDGLITFTVDADTLGEIAKEGDALGVDNTGVLRARSGLVAITAETASKIVNSVVNLDGVVDANAFAAGQDGGTVLVASKGDINITGEVRADGGVDGDGGQIITKADGTNTVTASALLSARGGDAAGDGGFVEISGRDFWMRGAVDTAAPNGANGGLLIDPTDITIGDEGDATADITVDVLELLGTATLVADNSITLRDLGGDQTWNAPGTVTLRTTGADGGQGTITFVDVNDTIAAPSTVQIQAAGTAPDVTIGNIVTIGNGADVSITGGNVSVASIRTGGSATAAPGIVTVQAFGDLAMGDLAVTANSAAGPAAAAAYLQATGDITVTGDTLVSAAGNILAFAGLGVTAGLSGSGDLSMTGDITVTANAVANQLAPIGVKALAGAALQAGGDVTITTPSSTMRVEANAVDAIEDGEDALAAAGLAVRAGEIGVPAVSSIVGVPSSAFTDPLGFLPSSPTAGGGDIAITGNTVVSANAGVAVAAKDIGSGAGVFTSDVAGSAKAVAGAYYVANAGTSTEAAAGDVTITGDTTVNADAVIAVGDIAIHNIVVDDTSFIAFSGRIANNASADALFSIDADGDVTVNSDITVTADAHIGAGNLAVTDIFLSASYDEFASFVGFYGNVVGLASAEASFNVNAGGAVNIGTGGGGAVTVGADATIDVGTITVSGTAYASSDDYSSATAEFRGFVSHVADSARADASINISSAGGDVTVGNAIAVDANADITIGDINVAANVIASDSSSGYGDGASASFKAFNNALADGADANAQINIDNAAGAVNLTGGVAVDADATLSVGDIAIDGVARASASSAGTAKARFYGFGDNVFDNTASADATVSIADNAGGVTIAGGLSADATAASAAGDITIAGIGDAIIRGGDGNSSADAVFWGVYGDVFVGSAVANAQLTVAGNDGAVDVSGALSAKANADVTAGAIDITGSAHADGGTPSARGADADVYGIGDDILESASAIAKVDLDRNRGDVTLDGLEAVGTTDITVGDITIRGGRTISTDLGSSFVRGGAIARDGGGGSAVTASFTAIGDDVLDSGRASGYATITNTWGDVTIDGDVTVSGILDISIGEISMDAKASAQAEVVGANATAQLTGIETSVLDNDASASGSFVINDTLGSEGAEGDTGNVTITGNVDVTGEGALTAGGFTTAVDVTASAPSGGRARADAVLVDNEVFDDTTKGDAWVSFSGNAGDVTVEGDINVLGAMQVSAGDVTADANVTAVADNGGSARANFDIFGSEFFDSSAIGDADLYISRAQGDVSLGGVTVTADGRLVLGDVNVTATVAATADRGARANADMTVFSYELFEDQASGNADFEVSYLTPLGDVTVDGPVNVSGRGHMVVGDVTVTGDVTAKVGANQYTSTVTSAYGDFTLFEEAVMSSEADAHGFMSVSGAKNVTLNGDITLLGEGLMTIGDVAIDAGARASAFGNGGNNAHADFTAFSSEAFDPWDDIDAWAELSVRNLAGALTVDGAVSGRAIADMGVGDITLDGDALAIARGGPSGTPAFAPNARAHIVGVDDNLFASSAMVEASAGVYVSGVKGGVTFNDDITMEASGTRRVGDLTVRGLASASADGASVDASASVTGFDYEIFDEPDEDSSAEAWMTVSYIGSSGEGGTADVTINGAVTLTAVHKNHGGDITITGVARAESEANSGRANATFTGLGSELIYSYEGMASADLSMTNIFGDLNLNGDIALSATESITVGDIAIDGQAIASVGDASDPVAFASFIGVDNDVFDLYSASADASINIWNVRGDLNRTGKTTVEGTGRIAAGSISILGLASAEGSIGSGNATARVTGISSSVLYGTDADGSATFRASRIGGDINWTGDIDVTGNGIQSVGDVNVDSKLFVDNDASTASGRVTGIGGSLITSSGDADADLYMGAAGDINITGDVLVVATGTAQVGDVTLTSSSSVASGTSIFGSIEGIGGYELIDRGYAYTDLDITAGTGEGVGGVNITGDVTARADASARTGTITGFEGNRGGAAYAYAYLDIFAAQVYGGGTGDINIAGNVITEALANVDRDGASSGGRATAWSQTRIDAANDITIGPKPATEEDAPVGSSDVVTRAIADTDGSQASANANLKIEAGEATGGSDVARVFVSEGDDGYGGEIVLTDGNLVVLGDILSFASANADGATLGGDSETTTSPSFVQTRRTSVNAGADLSLIAHGEPPAYGNLTNHYDSHEPQAIARVNGGMEAFVNATQSDLDATVAADTDGSPYTYGDSDSNEYAWAEITVHWHGEGKIFGEELPAVGGEGIDPYILIKDRPVPPSNTGTPITPAGALALLPGGATCNFGTGGFTIDPDGSVLFGQYVFDIDPADLDLAACDDNVRYPIFTDQTL